jgi:hypothetical protein
VNPPCEDTPELHLLDQRQDDDHDDHGGLHRDLTATGSAMGRRELLRRVALGAGALALLGYGGDGGTGVLVGADAVIDTGSVATGLVASLPVAV